MRGRGRAVLLNSVGCRENAASSGRIGEVVVVRIGSRFAVRGLFRAGLSR